MADPFQDNKKNRHLAIGIEPDTAGVADQPEGLESRRHSRVPMVFNGTFSEFMRLTGTIKRSAYPEIVARVLPLLRVCIDRSLGVKRCQILCGASSGL